MLKRTSARQALAANLARLRDRKPLLRTGTQIQAKTAGRVVQRTFSNMTRADKPGTNSPTLDNIDDVAAAYGLEAWQLLLTEESVGPRMYQILMAPHEPAAAPDDGLSRVELDENARKKRRPVLKRRRGS